jgi:hypothetical protein
MHFERGLEETFDEVVAAERMRNPHVAGDDRSDGEHDERHGHRGRRIVRDTVAVTSAMTVPGMRSVVDMSGVCAR